MNNAEQWRTPPGYEGRFEVSDRGRVRRLVRIRHLQAGIVRTTTRADGYVVVCLSGADGTRRNWLVHRLVLTAFWGPRASTVHGAHLDGDRGNNELANLRWCTPQENESHKRLHGRTTEGAKNGCARLDEAAVRAIRASYVPRSKSNGGMALARRYGISFQHVSDLVRGNRWNHLTTTQGA